MTVTAKDILQNMLKSEALKDFIVTYNTSLTVFLAIATLGIMLMIIFNIVKVAKSGTNAPKRSEAISGLLVCSACFAAIGGIDIIFSLLLSIISPI